MTIKIFIIRGRVRNLVRIIGVTVGSKFDCGQGRNFSLDHCVQASSGAHSALCSSNNGGSVSGGKGAGAEVLTPPYVFLALCSTEHRDNLSFLF
jgi:hypothetical protein